MRKKTRRLEIVRALGKGGMATVHLALLRDGTTRRVVAAKTLHPFLFVNPASAAVLEHEARVAARIRHPNVVGVIEYWADGDAPVLVMEWVDGVDLGKLARAATACGRRLPLDVVSAIACDLLAGLHAAHESARHEGDAAEIVHRDVSPQNVLVGFDGITRVTDFGIAKAAWRARRTETGSIKGKLGYLAPEQLAGRCDRRSDVYASGAVLWELLTGTRLRSRDGVAALVDIVYGFVDPPSARVPEAKALDDVVMCALEPSPDARFATAADMRALIARAVPPANAATVRHVVGEILQDSEVAKTSGDEVTVDERFAA